MNKKIEMIGFEAWKKFLPQELQKAEDKVLKHLFTSFANYVEENRGRIIDEWLDDGDDEEPLLEDDWEDE
jgi:hypothetical protein